MELKESTCSRSSGIRPGSERPLSRIFGGVFLIVHERLVVALEDAEEVRQVARPVVDDLGAWASIAAQENAAHADERLDISLVRNSGEDGQRRHARLRSLQMSAS